MNGTDALAGVSVESLVSRVADEFMGRLDRGEQPQIEEYAGRHPQIAAVLRQVLPALQVLRAPAQGPASAGDPADSGPAPVGCLGDYRILREIARGGMGVVYQAEQISLGRRVALKVLPFAAALDARQLQRFKNEAQAAAQLHHTNIVPVFGVGCERGVHYYAMQLIDGQTLAAMILQLRQLAGLEAGGGGHAEGATPPAAALSTERSARGPAYFRTVARLGAQAAEALEHAHQLGVVHRDVKPANLMVDGRGNLWVTDFGLAHVQGDAKLTLTGDLLGTLRYMSPEQALAQRVPVDHRTDVYSLGATLYELLTLEPAFAGQDRQELLRQIAFEDPRPPRRLNRAVPLELETIVLKAMAKNPDERYATAQELAEDLGRFLEDRPIQARRPTVVQRLRKWARRHTALVWTVAVAASAAALVSAVSTVLIAVAYKAETRQRRQAEADYDRAERNLRLSLRALDEVYLGVVEERLISEPGLERGDPRFLLKVLTFYEEFARQNSNNPAVRRETAKALRRVGFIQATLGRHARAEEAFGQAITAQAELAAEFPDNPEYRWDMVWSHNVLGCLQREAGRFREAEAIFRQALALLEPLASRFPDQWVCRRDIGGAQHNLALLLLKRGLLPEALRLLGQAIDHQQAALKSAPREEAAREYLSNHYSLQAAILTQQGKYPDAEKAYGLALAGRARLVKDSAASQRFRAALAVENNCLGELLRRRQGRPREAAQAHRQALATFQELAANFPNVPAYRGGLADSYAGLGAALKKVPGELPAAAQAQRQALEVYEKLLADFPEAPLYRQRLGVWHYNWGNGLAASDPPQAEKSFERALALQQQLLADFPHRPDYASELASTLNNLALLFQGRGDEAGVRRLLGQAIGYQQAALESCPRHAAYRDNLRKHYTNLCRALIRVGNHHEAARVGEKPVELFPDAWLEHRRAASVLGACAIRAAKDPTLTEEARKDVARRYADRAMALLRQAVARGYNDAADLRKSGLMQPLRQREDYRRLLAELEQKTKQ
jgi:serine/threonine protein kinase